MRSLTKTVLLLSFVALSICEIKAQSVARSAYNIYGVGTLEQPGLTSYEAMGFTGIGSRDDQVVNLENPAALNALIGPNHVFDIGLYYNNLSQSTRDQRVNSASSSLNSLNFWFRGGRRTSFSFGWNKFSDATYDITDVNAGNDELGDADSRFVGTGGLSTANLAFGYQMTKFVSIGSRLSFLFANLESHEYVSLEDISTDLVIREQKTFLEPMVDLGLQVTVPLGDQRGITIGATYRPGIRTNIQHESNIIRNTSDSINSERSTDLTVPHRLGFGLGLKLTSWDLNIDYEYENWGINAKQDRFSYNDRFIASVGIQYQKDRFSDRYLSRTMYRLGGGTHSNYVQVDGVDFLSFYMTGGLGLPIARGSILNLSYQYYHNGTHTDNLILEQTNRISLNFSMSDIWFRKRMFD